ncbi:YdcH family protein [Caulobacter sp. KR2-114]|uniref:YdcH family protein n=1 Tax=Caulobacter sp. KR2-114 TaxID=3400912 RepID=UPI003C0BC7F4
MNDDEPDLQSEAAVRAQIAHLRQEHQDLDAAVCALEAQPQADQLQVARLKKKKLVLRDQITKLEDGLTPDIIA